MLDLHLDSDLHFDLRTSSFDYTEVFGDFAGLDFTASFEDLIGQSSGGGGGGYDSSDEPWYGIPLSTPLCILILYLYVGSEILVHLC